MNLYVNLCKIFLTIILLSLLTSSIAQSGNVNWNNWSFSYEAGADRSGLVLRDVTFEGKTIIKKASFPVMRVRYDGDICGPYADILSTFTFRPATQGAPDSACDDETLCQRTYSKNGEQVLELGINAQIGEYQLYQSYYFTPSGKMDSRIFSRGLQCVIDHDHHAYWMFDFDIGDADNDEVRTKGTSLETIEFNAKKGDSSLWSIQDTITGEEVVLTPSIDDGTADSFAPWDIAVRRAKEAEMGPWVYGAYGEIGSLFFEQEPIVGTDLVVWYVSHMRHLASEGEDLWHASGPTIQVVNVNSPDPDPDPEPDPDPDPDNLLSNPSFSNSLSNWSSCSGAGGMAESINAGAEIFAGGCLYQFVPATAGTSYTLSCDARRTGSAWTSTYLSFANSNWSTLNSVNAPVTTTDYKTYSLNLNAPTNTSYAVVVLYSEAQARFDDCVLVTDSSGPVDPPSSSNLLVNGGFESGLSNWQSCANAANLSTSNNSSSGSQAAQVSNAGCMYQQINVEAGAIYKAKCDALSDGNWTTLLLTFMDSSYASVSNDFTNITSSSYQSKELSLAAPANSVYGALSLYSEGTATFDNCSIVEQ